MRVLVPLHGFVAWTGGLAFARFVVAALLAASAQHRIALTIAVPRPGAVQRLRDTAIAAMLGARGWMHGSGMPRGVARGAVLGAAAWLEDPSFARMDCDDTAGAVAQAASAGRFDAVFPSLQPLPDCGASRVGYLFDFQHRYLPELFSARQRRNRDHRFSRLAASSDALVVNSRAARDDAVAFLGASSERVLAMPFTPYAMPDWFVADVDEVRARFGLAGRFLLVCNQFWVHKDHLTAIRALAVLHRSPAFADLQLVMTGATHDHRDPTYLRRLRAEIALHALDRHVHIPGHIAKADQIALMRGCELVLQPTRFEGGPGGGSVYEAVGLGVRSVVSDIPVNREIDHPSVSFFRTGDPDDLAGAIGRTLVQPWSTPAANESLAASAQRLESLGGTIARFLDAIATHRRNP